MSIRQIFDFGCALILIGALALSSAYAAKPAPAFIADASVANQFEISSSEIALQTSQNQEVRNFAQQMVDDHTHIRDQMKAVVSASDARLDAPSPGIDAQHEKMISELKSLSGAAFDKRYVGMQLAGHKEVVALFSDYAKHGDDPDLKSFAQRTLPVMQGHLEHIKQLKNAM